MHAGCSCAKYLLAPEEMCDIPQSAIASHREGKIEGTGAAGAGGGECKHGAEPQTDVATSPSAADTRLDDVAALRHVAPTTPPPPVPKMACVLHKKRVRMREQACLDDSRESKRPRVKRGQGPVGKL